MKREYRPFSNGTQFLDWEASNCERCKKFSKCKLRDALDVAYLGDGSVTRAIAKGLGYLDNEGSYVWPCNDVKWTKEWVEQWKHKHPE